MDATEVRGRLAAAADDVEAMQDAYEWLFCDGESLRADAALEVRWLVAEATLSLCEHISGDRTWDSLKAHFRELAIAPAVAERRTRC